MKKILDDDIKIGQHLWVKFKGNDKILVVMKNTDGYDVCGAWECGMPFDSFEIIEKISVPKNYEKNPLLYLNK